MYSYDYPRPMLTVDMLLLSEKKDDIFVLLVRRKNDPFKGKWAFPGGFVEEGEMMQTAALRELKEETGFTTDCIEQFRAYSDGYRDPRGWSVTVVYFGWLDKQEKPHPGDDAMDARWFSLDDLPDMAFDHWEIVMDFISAQ